MKWIRSKTVWLQLLWAAPMLVATAINARFMLRTHGFPLDDAFIYLQYVENLSQGMGLSFNPGEVSFGVTSLLYPLLSAIVFNLLPFVDEIYSMQIVGVLAHAALIYFAQRLVYEETDNLVLASFTGFTLALCRLLYFTAAAGLETLLFHALVVGWAYAALRRPKTHPLLLGLLAGFLFLARPEGLALAGGYVAFLIVYATAFAKRSIIPLKQIALEAALFVGGVLLLALPYTLYIYSHSGLLLPTTFYGKLISHNEFTTWSLFQKIREGFYSLTQGYQAIIQQDATLVSYCILIGLSFLSLLGFAYQCGRKTPSPYRFAARAALFCLFLFPVLFGSAFHISAQFGGYAVRYIQIIIVLFHIEAAFGLFLLVQWLTARTQHSTRRALWANGAALLLAGPLFYIIAERTPLQLKLDLDFYEVHSEKRQGVRKLAAEWIRENTPPESRVLLGSTGLGVIGAYCERYCKDEGGLLHPDIFPYLKGFNDRSPHWARMLEYMKHFKLDYYTTYSTETYHNPISHPTRHTELVACVSDPELVDNPEYSWFSEICIFKFESFERYDLWRDTPGLAVPLDRAETPRTEGRIHQATWGEHPVVVLDAGMHYFEAHYEMLMPDNAAFKTALMVNVPKREYGPDEWIRFNVYVDRNEVRDVVYTETFPLHQLTNKQPFKTIELDVSKYNNQFDKLVLTTATSPMTDDDLYQAGFVEPILYNAKQELSE
ncbi:MAG: hypothetical protein P9L94_17170 [Candidatus Hinthialibacter antarcticus]|nr:hypothetical protein [Candidatus Hinthialibacter antarcticus]